MSTLNVKPIPSDILADLQAVADSLAAGRLVDPEIAQRVRARSEKAQQELVRQYGVRELAVDLIRAIRDGGYSVD
jgi:hypothetical protein